MTEFVEDWIRRAGERTQEIGYPDLGIKLIKHAVHERNHHLMMVKDTHNLVKLWNQEYAPPFLNADSLINRSKTESVQLWQNLHEDCIKSASPFGQIVIEYEIEHLSIIHGPVVIENAVLSLGSEIKSFLTFVCDHVEIDAAHTVYNREAISKFVEENPSQLDILVGYGAKALEVYGSFLSDCCEMSDAFEETSVLV